MTRGSIVVIGSINMDLVCRTARMPEAGETILGSDFVTIPGGKGANQAVAAAHDEGIDLPLIDLAMSDPYANATAKVEQGKYFGIATVLGVPCHHLAFTQENVDWQVWIEDGPQPLIRKFVITHKNDPGAPEFTALITHWNLTDRIADSNFVFEQPKGVSKIEMRTDEPGNGSTK